MMTEFSFLMCYGGVWLTALFFNHSWTRSVLSSRLPVTVGYSGSIVSLGNMYCLPPPKITYNKIIEGFQIDSFLYSWQLIYSSMFCEDYWLGPYVYISIMDELVCNVLASPCNSFRGQLFIAVPASFRGVGVTGCGWCMLDTCRAYYANRLPWKILNQSFIMDRVCITSKLR